MGAARHGLTAQIAPKTKAKAKTRVAAKPAPQSHAYTALAYPGRFTADDTGRILVTFKDFPECLTDGADIAEAMVEAKDALSEAILGRLERGESIPNPAFPRPGERQVAPAPDAALKMALRRSVRDLGIGPSELGQRMEVDEKEARRVLDPTHRTKLARMYQALVAVGQDVVITTMPVSEQIRQPAAVSMAAINASKMLGHSSRSGAKPRPSAKRKAAAKRTPA